MKLKEFIVHDIEHHNITIIKRKNMRLARKTYPEEHYLIEPLKYNRSIKK